MSGEVDVSSAAEMHAVAAAAGLGQASAASAAPLPTLMHMGYGAPHHRHAMLASNHQDQSGMCSYLQHRSAWWKKFWKRKIIIWKIEEKKLTVTRFELLALFAQVGQEKSKINSSWKRKNTVIYFILCAMWWKTAFKIILLCAANNICSVN